MTARATSRDAGLHTSIASSATELRETGAYTGIENLTESKYLQGLQCHRLLWLASNQADLPLGLTQHLQSWGEPYKQQGPWEATRNG